MNARLRLGHYQPRVIIEQVSRNLGHSKSDVFRPGLRYDSESEKLSRTVYSNFISYSFHLVQLSSLSAFQMIAASRELEAGRDAKAPARRNPRPESTENRAEVSAYYIFLPFYHVQ